MKKTCKVCKIKYQTMEDKGYSYCNRCAVELIRDIALFLQPILFELSRPHLDMLSTVFVHTNLHVMNELDRRERYYANMMAQRKQE